MQTSPIDPRILKYIEVLRQFEEENFDLDFDVSPAGDEAGQLGLTLKKLGALLEIRQCEFQRIDYL